MSRSLNKPKLLVVGILLTVAALIGADYLPARTLRLTAPGATNYNFLMMTRQGPDTGTADPALWVDAQRLHWRCHYTAALPERPCGLVLVLSGKDPSLGRDLSGFDSIELDLVYRGPSSHVRLSMRIFDPRFSKVADGNSSRLQSMNLRLRDIGQLVSLKPSELTVPEWWTQQFDLPREYNRPSLKNVTSVTIDVPVVQPGETHELELRSLVLKGQWVGRDRIYLAILCAWLLVASVTVLRNWKQLRSSHSRQQREIDALTQRTRQLRVEQEQLRRLATIDELTGVLNRRGLEQALDDLESKGQGLTLVLMDIDHFKHINDRYGHDRGDEVLQRLAAVVAANLRASDVFGRWGGEEFLVACPGTGVQDAARLADKLRLQLQQAHFKLPGGRIEVTASFGLAVCVPEGSTASALRRADAALYRAKDAGRNRIELDTTVLDAPSAVG